MLRQLALVLAASSEPAWAGELAGAAEESAAAAAERARLDHAIELYIAGESAQARNELLVIVLDPTLADSALQREARVWLGEVQYAMGELQAAEDTFRAALAYQPDLVLDPFVHPPDVVAFFDAVRATAQVQVPVPPFPTDPDRPSWLVLAAPGGIQFYNGQPVLGALTGGTVGGLGAVTLGMRLWLRAQDEDPDRRGVQIYDDPDRVRTLRTFRAVENTLGFAALGVWGIGMVQGVLHSELKAELVVGPTGAAVEVRF